MLSVSYPIRDITDGHNIHDCYDNGSSLRYCVTLLEYVVSDTFPGYSLSLNVFKEVYIGSCSD